ncbi:MAG TPA: DNA polymerase III subunit delta [Alphaproteobacteria bacterium]|nr:DNA polymerase III subunit delta [Alphaproteobacteria bacterium]
MKLTTGQISGFLQKPDPAIKVILLYGPDAGLVRERAEAIAKKTVSDINDPFRTASLTGAIIAEDPARLMDEMTAQALGGGTRLVRVQQATESMTAGLATFLKEAPACDALLLIEGGDLEKRSKLRAACENDAGAVAIPCYVEEGPARQRAVTDILQAENLRIARDALMFLCDILPPDRIAMRSELEKLALYVRGKNVVVIEDILAVVQDAGAAELDDLIFAVGAGDLKRATLLMDRLLEEQTSVVAILRSAQRHFIRLQWARQQMDTGMSAGEAVKKLQPPVFWKYADSMTAQLRRWPAKKLESALQRLFDAEAAVKRTGTPDTALCSQLLLGMAA